MILDETRVDTVVDVLLVHSVDSNLVLDNLFHERGQTLMTREHLPTVSGDTDNETTPSQKVIG